LVVATLGDVLFTRCSGSSLRVNLQPNISFLFVVYELLFFCLFAIKNARRVQSLRPAGENSKEEKVV